MTLEDKPTRGLGQLSELLGFRFRRIQNHLARGLTQRPQFDAGRPGELSALAILEANPGLSQVELAQEIGLDATMVVVLIDDLEQRGFAQRSRTSADRRRNSLFITPSGEAALRRWMVAARENEKPIRDTLSEAEFEQLLRLLDRIYDRCFNHAQD
jgi:DNA-binding MarR family transcriptional regulator